LIQNGLFLLLEKAKGVFKAKLAVQQSLLKSINLYSLDLLKIRKPAFHKMDKDLN
jgi:hypothetical protein